MAYTHHWYQQDYIPTKDWEQIQAFVWAAISLSDVPIAGPVPRELPEVNDKYIAFNGAKAWSQDFYLSKACPPTQHDSDRPKIQFCKTHQLPYDEVVVAILLYLQRHYSHWFYVISDGEIFVPGHEEGRAGQKLLELASGYMLNQSIKGKAE